MLTDVVTGKADFTQLLVLDVSRWGRFQDPDEGAHYEFLCRTHGVQVTYCREAITTDPSGHLYKQVKRIMAAEFAAQLSERICRGKRRAAEAGRAHGNWPRYLVARRIHRPDGTPGQVLQCGEFRDRPGQTLRLTPSGSEQSTVVRLIFSLFTGGEMSFEDIARRLNNDGLSWTGGELWTRRRIGRMLRDPLVTGRQHYGQSRTVLRVRSVEPDEAQRGYVQVFEPIVTPTAFDAVQLRLKTLNRRQGYTDQEMIEGLRKLYKRKGQLTGALVDSDPKIPCARRYCSRFGTLRAAFQLAGYVRNADDTGRLPSAADIVFGLRRLRAEAGWLNADLIHADPRLPTRHYIKKIFGSLTNAYAAAGLI